MVLGPFQLLLVETTGEALCVRKESLVPEMIQVEG